MQNQQSTYEVVNDKITAALKTGTVPWQQDWTSPAPRNLATQSCYRGVNAVLLRAAGRTSPHWLTRRQLEEHACHQVKGQRPAVATFWRKNEGAEKSTLLFYPVWCLDMLENAPVAPTVVPAPGMGRGCYEAAERIIRAMPHPPKLSKVGDKSYYDPKEDRVNVPRQSKFNDLDTYYSTVFHELIHATRAESRCNRTYRQEPEEPLQCGACDYSREELVAEIGTAMLCAEVGIHHKAHGGDGAGWLRAIESDEKLFVHACAHAQRAADYILGRVDESTAPRRGGAPVGAPVERSVNQKAA